MKRNQCDGHVNVIVSVFKPDVRGFTKPNIFFGVVFTQGHGFIPNFLRFLIGYTVPLSGLTLDELVKRMEATLDIVKATRKATLW